MSAFAFAVVLIVHTTAGLSGVELQYRASANLVIPFDHKRVIAFPADPDPLR